MWEVNGWDVTLQEITQWLPSLFYVVHQQFFGGNNGLYMVVVDTISLSYNIGELGITRSNGRIVERIINVLHFPRCWG